MTQINISATDLFEEYKRQVADLNHDLMLERIKTKKLMEILQQYEKAEADRARTASVERQKAATSVRDIPLPPALPPSPETVRLAAGPQGG